MFNHGRTLLLNRQADAVDFPGFELVPRDFVPVDLSAALMTVRNRLFGANPDVRMMRYRVRQYVTLIHSTPLVDWMLALDPRITYSVGEDQRLNDDALFRPVVSQIAGAESRLSVSGSPTAPDASGRMFNSYEVDILTSTTVEVKRINPPIKSNIVTFDISSGVSAAIPLPDSGYSIMLKTDNPGASWIIEVTNRPQRDLAHIVVSLQSIGEPVLLGLFGLERVEPWLTVRNIWQTSRETPLRLAAALMALIYRTELLRTV